MASTQLDNAMAIINQLSTDDQRLILQALQNRLEGPAGPDTWQLEGTRLAFMLQHKDEIEAAYAADDMAALDALESSKEYRALFGEMPWDEAYDRFEETWWSDSGSDEAWMAGRFYGNGHSPAT